MSLLPNRYKPDRLDEILEAVKAGRLDGRTRQAKAVEEVKIILEEAPEAATLAMLRASIATNHLLEREILDFVAKNTGKLLDQDGRLPPAISEDLLKMQNNSLKYLKALDLIERRRREEADSKAKDKDNPKDVSDIILECSE
jgi:anion-transporting  ArsA/GET3 family ATPase